jgi:hypothetical protein
VPIGVSGSSHLVMSHTHTVSVPSRSRLRHSKGIRWPISWLAASIAKVTSPQATIAASGAPTAPSEESARRERGDTTVQAGCNAVNFLECTFLPCQEEPDHDHPDFQRTLRTYYSFCPSFPHQLKAWKAADVPRPDLASPGGRRVAFSGLRMYPRSFRMRHYLFLSIPHAVEKAWNASTTRAR